MIMAIAIESEVSKGIARTLKVGAGARTSTSKTVEPDLNNVIDAALRKGILVSVAETIRSELEMSDADFARYIGISVSTLKRKRSLQGRLSVQESDRLYRLTRIYSLAAAVLGSKENAREWMMEPQFGLDGARPVELLQTEVGERHIEGFLIRAEYGDLL